jgi:type IV pilus assembly protein PilX
MKINFAGFTTPRVRKNERGFVLVTALIFLVALTILGISALGVNSQEEKMLGYSRDRQMAFQAADAALRDAERHLGTIAGSPNFIANCAAGSGLYQVQTSGKPIWSALESSGNCKDDAWAGMSSAINAPSGKSFKYGVLSGVGDFKLDASRTVASQPRFIIELLSMSTTSGSGVAEGSLAIGRSPGSQKYVYRVTAVGFGQRLSTRVMLQAVYRQ